MSCPSSPPCPKHAAHVFIPDPYVVLRTYCMYCGLGVELTKSEKDASRYQASRDFWIERQRLLKLTAPLDESSNDHLKALVAECEIEPPPNHDGQYHLTYLEGLHPQSLPVEHKWIERIFNAIRQKPSLTLQKFTARRTAPKMKHRYDMFMEIKISSKASQAVKRLAKSPNCLLPQISPLRIYLGAAQHVNKIRRKELLRQLREGYQRQKMRVDVNRLSFVAPPERPALTYSRTESGGGCMADIERVATLETAESSTDESKEDDRKQRGRPNATEAPSNDDDCHSVLTAHEEDVPIDFNFLLDDAPPPGSKSALPSTSPPPPPGLPLPGFASAPFATSRPMMHTRDASGDGNVFVEGGASDSDLSLPPQNIS